MDLKYPEPEYDIAVAGSGGAGVCAAFRAAQAGKKVVLLEKKGGIGGSTAMCRGIGAADSKIQKASPLCRFTGADLMEEFAQQTNYLADNALIQTFVANSGHTVDWLIENGCKMEYVGTGQAIHKDSRFQTFFEWGEKKIRDLKRMTEFVKAQGGAVLTNTAAESLKLKDGKICGITARTKDGETLEISCRAVIIATGGYGNNPEMLDRALKGVKVNRINSGGQTGDGIRMGTEAGAATENLDAVEFHGTSLPFDKLGRAYMKGTPGALSMIGRMYQSLWVNRRGQRFVNEEISSDITFSGNVAFRQGGTYYALFDQNVVNILAEEGIAALGYDASDFMPAKQGNIICDTLMQEIEDGQKASLTYAGGHIQALSDAMGIDPDALEETLLRYNALCEAGEDTMFGKKKEHLMAFKTPPYYAVEQRAAELCTLGGLKIDTKMRVLDQKEQVIEGLYAAGCDCAGGLFNNAYVSLEGITLGWACTSGKLAAEHAAAYLDA